MGKKIERSEVEKVAMLSRLQLTAEEVDEFAGQLSSILGYVEKMNELDTSGVQPLAHCLPVTNCFRDDRVRESLGVDKTLANAPQKQDEYFKVPKILEDNGGA